MLYLFLTDFDPAVLSHEFEFNSASGPVSCVSIGIRDDADFEGIETFTAVAMVPVFPTPPTTPNGYSLTVSTVPATITITDRNGKYTSCPASQLVRNTCNIGI